MRDPLTIVSNDSLSSSSFVQNLSDSGSSSNVLAFDRFRWLLQQKQGIVTIRQEPGCALVLEDLGLFSTFSFVGDIQFARIKSIKSMSS